MNRLGHIAAESGRIPKGALVRWAMQLLLVTVQRGSAEIYRRSGLIISRASMVCTDSYRHLPLAMCGVIKTPSRRRPLMSPCL